MKLLKTRIALAVGLLATSSLALSATESTTIGVTAEVVDACSVTAAPLAFGQFDTAVNNTDKDASTTIDVTCSNGTAYNVGLDAGGATGATVTSRQMTGGTGTDLLDYALYSDSGRSSNWGDTVGTDTIADTGSGALQVKSVYGRVPSGQSSAPTGSYSDTINVTVTF